MSIATLYKIGSNADTNQLSISQVWEETNSIVIPVALNNLFFIGLEGKSYVIGIDQNNLTSAFIIIDKAPWVQSVPSKISFSQKWDIIEPFRMGNQQYLLCYNVLGNFSFYIINNDLTISEPYLYRRNHEPATTDGFSVVKPFTIFGVNYFIAYSYDTGKVCIFSINTIAQSPSGIPPINAHHQWAYNWAKNWSRFAFFQLGGENFFFKINFGRLNVNIDHVHDDPKLGTIEVATQIALDQALDINVVVPFYLECHPYFITYSKDNIANFNRFKSDCSGWDLKASVHSSHSATQILPIVIGEITFVLFYS